MDAATRTVRIERVDAAGWRAADDRVAVEEPLEIRVAFTGEDGGRVERALSVTMRTPGHDAELAAGFLVSEGLIRDAGQLLALKPCGPTGNVVKAALRPDVSLDWTRFERHVYTSSSCGVCGKTSLAAVKAYCPALPRAKPGPALTPELLLALTKKLRDAQESFSATGGLHATALFTNDGELLLAREDVGRHNAFDKVVGRAFLDGRLPLAEHVALVSGRASFELVQKAAMAGLGALAAIGAPSSLALDLARDAGMTLVGFLRDGRFNVYCGANRFTVAPRLHDVATAGQSRPAGGPA